MFQDGDDEALFRFRILQWKSIPARKNLVKSLIQR
jgi:hypothetical protein